MNTPPFVLSSFSAVALTLMLPAQVTWTQTAGSGAPQAYGASAFAENRSRLVAFGGEQGGFQSDTTREYDPATGVWTQLSPGTRPSPRRRAAMAYDAARGECVLFGGGFGTSTFLGDTWTWNGTAWTQKSPATSPSVRFGAAMCFDSVRQVVVLFGGFVPSGQDNNETWEWDGLNWTLRAPVGPSPIPRGAHRMAYDQARAVSVLYGGFSTPQAATVGDTWTWDGSSWSQGASGPGTLCDQLFVYDSHRQRVVLFGGLRILGPSLTDLGATWEWNGAAWTQRFPAVSPSARSSMANGFSPASPGRILSGGGVAGGTQFGTTFSMQPTSQATVTSFGAGCPSSVGPVGLVARSMPYIGGDFVHEINGASASTVIGVIVFGTSNTIWAGLPLPLSLAAAGAPGCSVLVSVDVTSVAILNNGVGNVTWSLPNLASAVGLQFFTQAVVFDPALAQPFQIGASSGRQFVIGSP